MSDVGEHIAPKVNFNTVGEHVQKKFSLRTHSLEEEEEYDLIKAREEKGVESIGFIDSWASLSKSALGVGIFGAPVSYMKAGLAISIITSLLVGLLVMHCLYILVASAQTLCKRTRTPYLSYPDLAEACARCSQIPEVMKLAKTCRYLVDFAMILFLFGACASYAVVMAQTIKQLVEGVTESPNYGIAPGYPDLKIYILCIMPMCILVSWVKSLSIISKFSVVGNCMVLVLVISTVYYGVIENPRFQNVKAAKNFDGFLQMAEITNFGMSCVCAIMPVENHLKKPYRFKYVHYASYSFILGCLILMSAFGYIAFQDQVRAPFIANCPFNAFTKIIRVCIFIMVFTTFALHFWIPFQLVHHYMSKKHVNAKHPYVWECFYKTIIVVLIFIIAIVFPDVSEMVNYSGTFLLSLLIFVYPNVIEIFVYGALPGFGRFHWRFYKCITIIIFGLVFCFIGSIDTGMHMIVVFRGKDHNNITTVNKTEKF